MPKATAEQTLKVKLQARALFEMGKYTMEEICKVIKESGGSLSRQTLSKWITEDISDVWQVKGSAKDIPKEDAQAYANSILDVLDKAEDTSQDEPPTPSIYTEEEQENIDILKRRNRQIDILTSAIIDDTEGSIYKTARLGIATIQKILIKDVSYYCGKPQPVGFENARNIDSLANSILKFAQVLGIVDVGSKVNINNNNLNAQQNNTSVQQDTVQKTLQNIKQDPTDLINYVKSPEFKGG